MKERQHEFGPAVPESFSRILDESVAATERPYGYTNEPPPADTGDFDQARLETKTVYARRKGRAV